MRDDYRAELEFHFAEAIDRLIEQGWSEADARMEVERRFGDRQRYHRALARLAQATGRRRTWQGARVAGRDHLRTAVRGLRRTPGVSLVIILLLACGIGANAALFGVLDRLLLSPPAHLADAARLRLIYLHRAGANANRFPRSLTYPDVLDFRSLPAFTSVSAYTEPVAWTLGTGANARKVKVQQAEASYFATLGVRAALGRFHTVAEDEPGAPLTAVISHRFWTQQYGADAGVLGRRLDLNAGNYEVVGVAPPGFTGAGIGAVDVWLPLRGSTYREFGRMPLESRTWFWTRAVGRLREGVSDTTAAAQLNTAHLAARTAFEADGGEPYLATQRPRLSTGSIILSRGPNPTMTSTVSVWLGGVGAIVLLVACANVANLLLARTVHARREFALRAALGARGRTLFTQVMTEMALLAGLAALAALTVAAWAHKLVRAFVPDVAFDAGAFSPRVFLFVAVAAGITVLLAGFLPAMLASRTPPPETLRTAARGNSGSRTRLRSVLMLGQIALSAALLVGAGLFARSLWSASQAPLGFNHAQTLVATIEFTPGGTSAGRVQVYREALAQVSALPGVQSAAVALGTIPLGGWTGPAGLRVRGVEVPDLPGGGPYLYSGTEGLFETLEVVIREGRSFEPREYRDGAEPVGMVSETFARTVWPDRSPIGECFTLDPDDDDRAGRVPEPCRRIVGVFSDFVRFGLDESPAVAVAVPAMPADRNVQGLLIRAEADPGALAETVRHAILGASRDVRFVQVDLMRDRFERLLQPWKLGATVCAVIGGLALLVAAIGLYSLLAFGVAERHRELAIRSALGARRSHLVRCVIGQAVTYVMMGLVPGLAIAWTGAVFLRDVLFGVDVSDPQIYGGVMLVLFACGLLAGLVPAWRATSVGAAAVLEAVE